jgi:uncharacterized DUF497 family protein
MATLRERLAKCTGFQWDEGNATKNWDKHDVSQAECEQVFFNRPLIVKSDTEHSRAEARYVVLGRTDESRLLFVAFTIRGFQVRVISAREMTSNERDRYPL